MMSATTDSWGRESDPSTGEAPSDPTLSALVPVRSTRRNVLLAVLAVVVLVAGWYSPTLLRPRLPAWTGGQWAVLPEAGVVLAAVRTDQVSAPAPTVASVRDVPGARVLAAWLDPPDAERDRSDLPTVDDVVASFPSDTALPRRATAGSPARIVVLWQITDCAALVEEAGPQLTLRGPVGTTSSVQLDGLAGPAFDLTLLEEEGICPEGTDPTPY